jgi:hypothetical protein
VFVSLFLVLGERGGEVVVVVMGDGLDGNLDDEGLVGGITDCEDGDDGCCCC